jgi:carnitine O-acetyltransferase
LPKLHIPKLVDTLSRFLTTLKPFQDPKRHDQTVEEVEAFGAPGGDGEKLQALLIEYAATRDSYMEEFWNDAYLTPDTASILNLNPFFLLEEGPDQKTNHNQVGRAASLVFASLKFASVLKAEELEPDVIKGTPICMAQFKHIFGSARIPQQERDFILNDSDASHVVVSCHNQLYYFKALHPDGAVGLSEVQIADTLEAIKADAAQIGKRESLGKAIGVLTTLDRSKWASTRDRMIAHSEHNNSALQVLDSALFVLVLDDFIPKDIHEAAANCLHGTYELATDGEGDFQAGTCVNRWYDKLQLIVCKDGSAGVNFEHSAIDGHTALRFVSDIFADTVVSFAKSITKTIYTQDHIPDHLAAKVRPVASASDDAHEFRPRRIEFEIPASVEKAMFFAETALGDQLLQNDCHVLEFREYGKSFIVENQMSPDSFVQMSMLLAHYQLYGSFVNAYEPVMTKWFLHGRTEAMRSATTKAKLFCEAWVDPTVKKGDKIKALKEATDYHSKMVQLSATGQGVDRHMYGLLCIAKKHGLDTPKVFHDDGWTQLNNSVLSTSVSER